MKRLLQSEIVWTVGGSTIALILLVCLSNLVTSYCPALDSFKHRPGNIELMDFLKTFPYEIFLLLLIQTISVLTSLWFIRMPSRMASILAASLGSALAYIVLRFCPKLGGVENATDGLLVIIGFISADLLSFWLFKKVWKRKGTNEQATIC